MAESLLELRERVFREKDYYWRDDLEDFEPRPATIDGIWDSEAVRYSGTHSILDIDRVVEVPAGPDWRGDEHGTVRPLAADRVREIFGTGRPAPAQFEAIANDYEAPGYRALMGALRARWTGYYVLLYDGDTPAHVGFWGSSGD